MQSTRRVVLFVAEAVTLAHYGRIATLSRSLAPDDYHVIVAADPQYRSLDEISGTEFYPIWSVPSSQFARALEQGSPLYDAKTLARYVEDDLALIDTVKPDLIVGDFRLSLAVSAPLRRIPYASVVNAYWSPYADIAYPVPDLPFTRYTGLSVGQGLFDLVRPFAFALHARPLNQVRRRYGLVSLGSDLRRTYTWGDYTLYADIPELVPTRRLPDNHRFLGPILWSTRAALPDWWDALPADRPLVFVTLGSSGCADLLPIVLEALSGHPVIVIVATAGKVALENLPPNVFVADYLPMNIASTRSTLVISNGGSLTTYQALSVGVPVLGICSNMDQLLNMNAVQSLGAGVSLRAARASSAEIRRAVKALLEGPSHLQAARQLGQAVRQYDVSQRFREIVTEIFHRSGQPRLP
jgi:UDP:flavonoid glycosyltransferase YjiC (YdhE family)